MRVASNTFSPPFKSEDPGQRLLTWIEAFGVFVLGFVLMSYFYAASPTRPGGEIGVPEHDSYYHIAMASMLPEHGLLAKLPWLQYTWFRDQGDEFVSHHWGFHLLLLPFVTVAEWLLGDSLAGGRWAIMALFGGNLLLFYLLLRHRRVPLIWLWLILFLCLPDQFYVRHGYVRAIGASLLFMQLILLALFAGRYVLAAVAIFGYVHLYLGAVLYGPVIVAAYTAAQVIGPRDDRRLPVRMVLITAAGWLLGVLTYPYAGGMVEFLRLQVFGTGLSPDIEVGLEWQPYIDAWFIVSMAGPLLGVWTLAITLRLRMGPRLDAQELLLLTLNFAFLLLMLKARRFVEYWPPICLLNAAYLAAPVITSTLLTARAWWARRGASVRVFSHAVGLVGLGFAAFLAALALARTERAAALMAEWRAWLLVAAIAILPVFTRIWALRRSSPDEPPPIGRLLGVAAAGATFLLVALCVALSVRVELPPARLIIPGYVWGALVAAYGLIPLIVTSLTREHRALPPASALQASLAVAFTAVLLPAVALSVSTQRFGSTASQLRCFYDLGAIRELMAFLKQHASPGDIVFTDDWDVFPVFFYHNRHNHYIVGLDPKFTHQRDPELWSRYVKISRGQVPATIRLPGASPGGALLPVGLEDIRERFRARYVIADRDHRRLAQALDAAPALAECVYPSGSYEQARNAEYVVFRIRTHEESEAVAKTLAIEPNNELSLSRIPPTSVSQGWGELGTDCTVENNPIRLGGRTYERGVGTHAPAQIAYELPADYDTFEAIVGIDDETEAEGSAVVSVELDGRRVFESRVLRGGTPPESVSVALRGARSLVLRAEPTDDGNRFDHVSWAAARLVRASQSQSAPATGSAARGAVPP